MSNNSSVAIGAIGGAITGTAAGYFVGSSRAAKLLGQYGILKTGKIGSDEFVKNQSQYVEGAIIKNMDKVHQSYKSSARMQEAFKKISQKAKEDFVSIAKRANSTKITWIAALAAAGTLIGVLIGKAIANKGEANQKEQA